MHRSRRICMQENLWFHLWYGSNNWNWSQTSFCNRKQASSQGPCPSSMNPVPATELRFAKAENTITFFKLSSGWCKTDFCVEVKSFFPLRYKLIVDDGIILKGLIVEVRHPYARSMSSSYTRDILEQILQWKVLLMLFMALYDIGHWLCDSLCQPCNSAKLHEQREPLVINPVTDLSLFVSACILDWNGLQYLIFIESYYSWF